jgi:hypothetical protein
MEAVLVSAIMAIVGCTPLLLVALMNFCKQANTNIMQL